jgi:hypothetical protein
MAARMTPVQIIANSLQVERIPGTRDNPFVNIDGQILRGIASHAIQMLEAYGYMVVENPECK